MRLMSLSIALACAGGWNVRTMRFRSSRRLGICLGPLSWAARISNRLTLTRIDQIG